MASRRDHTPFDVAIIGGGPAGASAARLLAQWGHTVVLLTKAPPTRTLAESLPPSCTKLFRTLGILDAVDRAGFYRSRGNTVWWGGGEPEGRSEAFGEGAWGYQIVRRDFDGLLLDLAKEVGVDVYDDATVREVDIDVAAPSEAPDSEERVRLEFEVGAAVRSVHAKWVLDCSGRAGVIARQGFRTKEVGQATVALVGVWRLEGRWDVPDETHTLIESYVDGWGWSVPIAPSVRYFAVMVNPGVTDLERAGSGGRGGGGGGGGGGQLESMYRAELAKTVHFTRLTSDAKLEDGPWACGASSYSASRFSGPRFLLVGDAGSFVDPLSSFGVKKAMASAWQAAVVVHTCLSKPEMEQPALAFFEKREQEMFESLSTLSARYFGDAARQHRHAFWMERADLDDKSGPGTGAGAGAGAGATDWGQAAVDVEVLRRDPDVLAAFDALRQAPRIDLRPTAQVRTMRRPAIRDNEVVMEDQLVASWPQAASVRFLRGVDLPKLVDMAPGHTQVPDLFETYNRACEPVILPDFLGALSVLLAKGMLENRATAKPEPPKTTV